MPGPEGIPFGRLIMYLASPNSTAVLFNCWLFGDRLVRISINFDEHGIWRGLQGYCRHIMNNLYLVPNVTVIVVINVIMVIEAIVYTLCITNRSAAGINHCFVI